MNKKIVVLIIIVIAVCAGVVFGLWTSVIKSQSNVPKSDAARTAQNPSVYIYNGNISSNTMQNCIATMALELKKVYVKEGNRVKKGDLLYLLDDSDVLANLSQAQAGIQLAQVNLEKAQLASDTIAQVTAKSAFDSAEAAYTEAKSNLERLATLQPLGGISQSDYEKAQIAVVTAEGQFNQAKANYETISQQSSQNVRAAQAQLAQARANLEAVRANETKRRVTSEIDGTVADVWARENNILAMGEKILDVVDYDKLILEIYVDQFEIPLFKTGETVPVHINAINLTVNGTISKISNQAIKTGDVSSFKVTIDLEKNPALKIGLLAEVKKNV